MDYLETPLKIQPINQGHLSLDCYTSLSEEELISLERIREKYKSKSIFSFSAEQAQIFIDKSYEAMGKKYRDRINEETKNFKRYQGNLDGVFLLISDSLRAYDNSDFFPTTPKESQELHASHQKKISGIKKKLASGYSNLTSSINETIPSVFFVDGRNKLQDALQQLSEIHTLVSEQISAIDFGKKSESAAESFVNSVCMSLVWNANIRPTKALTDSHQKTPLLRFLEVFYPVEARAVLARLYDRERSLPDDQRIGSTFIPPA